MLIIVGNGTKTRTIYTGGALSQTEKVPSRREAEEALCVCFSLLEELGDAATEHAQDVLRRYILMR